MPEFVPWPKIHRLFRDVIITEKIDGTNAAIGISDDGEVHAQSRKRIITPADDNYGFAKWVHANAAVLAEHLGPGLHFGEWCGLGINRGYGLPEKRFALFNAARWVERAAAAASDARADPLSRRVQRGRGTQPHWASSGNQQLLRAVP
jgi:hypothetical protein